MESYDITKDTGILSCQQTWFCGKPPSRGGFNHENIMILQQACHLDQHLMAFHWFNRQDRGPMICMTLELLADIANR